MMERAGVTSNHCICHKGRPSSRAPYECAVSAACSPVLLQTGGLRLMGLPVQTGGLRLMGLPVQCGHELELHTGTMCAWCIMRRSELCCIHRGICIICLSSWMKVCRNAQNV